MDQAAEDLVASYPRRRQVGDRGALLAMVPSLAAELAPRRIRVNAVSSGAIDTPIWSKSGACPEMLANRMESLSGRIPFGRFGTAREVAEVVAFLASDRQLRHRTEHRRRRRH